MDKNTRIFVAGHQGMVGSAVVRSLYARGYHNIVTLTRAELDLTDQSAVEVFFRNERIDVIVLAAAKVGGILANQTYPADFLYLNMMIEANVIRAAHQANIKRLIFLGSSCIYPRECAQPIREEYLLTGTLEKTNEAYAIAKIAGIKLCESFNKQYGTKYVSLMPTNLYGPNDNYDLSGSHVLPALIRKTHEAKIRGERFLTVWGSGEPRREFLHVNDLADAIIFIMENNYSEELINVGTGVDISIRNLAELIIKIVGADVEIIFDSSKPDGTPRKLLDVTRMQKLGWTSKITLERGVQATYADYIKDLAMEDARA